MSAHEKNSTSGGQQPTPPLIIKHLSSQFFWKKKNNSPPSTLLSIRLIDQRTTGRTQDPLTIQNTHFYRVDGGSFFYLLRKNTFSFSYVKVSNKKVGSVILRAYKVGAM